MDFSGGAPVVDLSSSMNMYETGGTISDTSGNLLFYTNGDTIWNKNHLVMPNGTGLINCQSATQGGFILKKPGSTNLYYVFTNDCAENNGINGVHYSIVDISLNGGLGDVIIKNTLLYAPSTEKFTATYHCNGTDIWLMGQVRNSNQFCNYLFTNTGINSTPVISQIGYIHKDDSVLIAGGMKVSPNGKKLAITHGMYPLSVIELYDFNTSSGILSNLTILSLDTSCYGLEFSSDNQKLYIQSGGGGNTLNKIFQFDLSSTTPSLIISSKTLIHSNNLGNIILGLQLSNIGKIFCSRANIDTLGIINNPNLLGLSSNLNISSIGLMGRNSLGALPQFMSNYFAPVVTSTNCTLGIYENENNQYINIFPNPTNDYFYLKNENHQKIILEITDLLGNTIQTNEYYEEKFKVDVSFLNKGIYILNIKQNNKQFKAIKLIKS